jgi:hypothetical protein
MKHGLLHFYPMLHSNNTRTASGLNATPGIREQAAASLYLLGRQHYENVKTVYSLTADPAGLGENLDYSAAGVLLCPLEVDYPTLEDHTDNKANQARVLSLYASLRGDLERQWNKPDALPAHRYAAPILARGIPFLSMFNVSKIVREVIEAMAFYQQRAERFPVVPYFAGSLFSLITGREITDEDRAKFYPALESAAKRSRVDEPLDRIESTEEALQYDPLAESVMIAAYRC